MEMLARERAAEQNVQYYLKATEEPIVKLLQAFEEYRQACQACMFADFENDAAAKGRALWHTHTEGKKYFHRALSGLRKQPSEQHVATRQLIKFYLQFLKDSQRFYREYIYQLGAAFGGIPELQAIAQQVKNDAKGEISQAPVSLALRQKVLDSCHQTLIYLGDLSRYRASEKLDKNPDFGPAIGYYSLACTLVPTSGMGHHQQAVVALEQREHLRAIYHLYRAIVVDEPHPNAANNLKLEFDKTNVAWDRGELIQKGSPNDPEVSKRTLVGWFVRLHSMCFTGEAFRGYEELEREVLGQLTTELKQRSLDGTFMRMIMTNLAAQFNAGERFQDNPTQENQNAFLQFFRINVKTFTALLQVFYDDLKSLDLSGVANEEEIVLADRLTATARRVLPGLRLYSAWLLGAINLLNGLSSEASLSSAVNQLWRVYARAVDLIAAVFPIWDLEDLDEVTYMLEEDVDTLGFKPLKHERTDKMWQDKQTKEIKPRFSDANVTRASPEEETLARVKDFLVDGLWLANDDDEAPIKLRGTRILHRNAEDVEPLPVVIPAQEANAVKTAPQKSAPEPPKKLSYAAAAASKQQAAKQSTPAGPVPKPPALSQHARLSRMVDDLVDDDDSNNPITPPQQHASYPAIVTKGDVSYHNIAENDADSTGMPDYSRQTEQPPIGTPATAMSPSYRSPKIAVTQVDRLQTLSNLWNDAPPVSSFPSGLPMGTLSSPPQLYSRGHSRVNSASSNRSRTSQNVSLGIADSWSSIDAAPRSTIPNGIAAGLGTGFGNFDQPHVASPLLFGAGGSVWSARPMSRGRDITPPNGQGG